MSEKGDGFISVRLREDLIRKIDEFINTDEAKELGYHSRAGFIDKILREKIRTRFEHLNVYDDHVTIIDYDLRRTLNIYFKEEGVWCEYDESEDCPHIEYVLTIPKVQEILEQKGWKKERIKKKFS